MVTVVDCKSFFSNFQANRNHPLADGTACNGAAGDEHSNCADPSHHTDHSDHQPHPETLCASAVAGGGGDVQRERTITDLLIDQIQFADLIVINKTETVSKETLDDVTAVIK
jgi:G3E family GTPase